MPKLNELHTLASALFRKSQGGASTEEWTDFDPKPMVAWFSPSTLTKAAIRAVLTTTIGQYGDRRETQSSLGPPGKHEHDKEDEIWIDFVADTGDGFDSTFTVARVMAQDKLIFGSDEIPRGAVILFGGDQVYPDPSNEAYRHRFYTCVYGVSKTYPRQVWSRRLVYGCSYNTDSASEPLVGEYMASTTYRLLNTQNQYIVSLLEKTASVRQNRLPFPGAVGLPSCWV